MLPFHYLHLKKNVLAFNPVLNFSLEQNAPAPTPSILPAMNSGSCEPLGFRTGNRPAFVFHDLDGAHSQSN